MSEQAPGQLHRPEVWSGVAPGYDDAIAPIMRSYAVTTLDLLEPSGGLARLRLPQLIGAALARAVPDLPAPAPPPWAHLCEAAGAMMPPSGS